jgi:hypothetical protein
MSLDDVAPGVFLAVPDHVTDRQAANALRVLGFDPSCVESLTWNRAAQSVEATVRYSDHRGGMRRYAVATVTVDVLRDGANPVPIVGPPA